MILDQCMSLESFAYFFHQISQRCDLCIRTFNTMLQQLLEAVNSYKQERNLKNLREKGRKNVVFNDGL